MVPEQAMHPRCLPRCAVLPGSQHSSKTCHNPCLLKSQKQSETGRPEGARQGDKMQLKEAGSPQSPAAGEASRPPRPRSIG